MKKALVLSLALIAALVFLPTVEAFAGPFLGVGGIWYGDESRIAFSGGMEWFGQPFGAEIAFNIAQGEFASGPDWYGEFGLVTELCISYAFAESTAPTVPEFRGLVGVGFPTVIGFDEDGIALAGFEPGLLFGVQAAWPDGPVAKILAYGNGEAIGVGLAVLWDFFGAPVKAAGGGGV